MKTARFGAACATALALAACGGGAHGQVALGDENANVRVSFAEKKSLEKMESLSHGQLPRGQDCVSSRSPAAADVAALIAAVNPYLESRTDLNPPVRAAELLDSPPRAEDRVAVFICAGMQVRGATVFRTVYLSGDYLAALKDAAAPWGGDTAYRSAVAFVLYHEIGHAALNHSALKMRGGALFDLPQELQADQFAYDAMAATHVGLNGIGLANAANQ